MAVLHAILRVRLSEKKTGKVTSKKTAAQPNSLHNSKFSAPH
jgi:hypothetical protein